MLMKILLHTLVFLLFALHIHATGDTFDAAQNLAKKYCQNPSLKKTGTKPTSTTLRSASEELPSYFIFSDDATGMFCIVSADGEKVIGYGDNYSDELPPQLQAALDMYATTLPQRSSQLRSAKIRENIPPFMDVVYGTRSPYNKFIPEREGSGPPVGCVPVALAQIAKYYEHPSKLMNDIPGYSHYSTTSTDTIFQIEGQKAEGRTYDWNLILNYYEKDTTEELNNEVAKLMWDCARSVETAFAQSGSSALTDMFFYSLTHYFGYNSDSLKKISRSMYYREEWLDLIHEELSKKRPIYMSGTSYNHGGHAFICDGYVDGYLHINWGWNGPHNGYFDIDILDYKHDKDKEQITPDNGYSFFETVIIGIMPGEGKTEYKKPKSANSIVQIKQEGFTVDTKYRATEKGFVMYTSFEAYNPNIDEDRNFTLGYLDKNGKFSFLANGESEYFDSNTLIIDTKRELDKSYLGKEIKLCVLESDKNDIEIFVQDTIYEWWHLSELFDTITIRIPDTIVNSDAIIEPKKVNIIGEYTDSTIAVNIEFQAEKPEGIMKYFALAIDVDGDTLMSETSKNAFSTESEESICLKRALKNLDLNQEISLLVVQTDFIPNGKLNKKNWDICKNFKPISFKLSDCKIFSKELVVDTIVHTTKGTKQSFEITFSNPTPFEYYNDVYFLINNEESTGVMIDIPANGKIKRTIERDMPLFTRYINGLFSIYNNFDVAAEMIFTKDTFSHVFYALNGGDETTLSLQILNGTKKKYTNTFVLVSDTDTIARQTVTVEPLTIAKFNHSLPVIASDTDFIALNYTPYAFYDNDNNLLGYVSQLDYYGTVSQSVGNRRDKYISIKLKPIIDSIMPPLIIGVTSSLEETDKYQMRQYTPDPAEMSAISIEFKLSNLFSLEKPKYIGLCKEDGTFYAYMELKWDEHNASPDILSNDINIIAVDGGIQISSDVDIQSLPIYNTNGSLIKNVELKQNSSLFVPLSKGVYIVGNKKILVTL